jgi:hypothetical protein
LGHGECPLKFRTFDAEKPRWLGINCKIRELAGALTEIPGAPGGSGGFQMIDSMNILEYMNDPVNAFYRPV